MKKDLASSGSALIYVLIATALFIALTITVSSMMQSSGGENRELRQVDAGEIMQFAAAMRTAVQTLKVNGYTDSQISFENPIISDYDYACADGTNHCKLFSPDGGGLSYTAPPPEWLDTTSATQPGYGTWIFSGNNEATDVGTTGNGASSADLLVILPWIRKDLCIKINEALGVNNPNGVPPQDFGNIEFTPFTGIYAAISAIGGNADIDGKRAGCVEGDGTPPQQTYHFFQVILAR